jgi:ribonuclease-3
MQSPEIIGVRDVQRLLSRYLPAADSFVGSETIYRVAMLHRSCGRNGIVQNDGDSASQKLPSELVGKSYERLELLGDAVLGLVTASYLYERYPNEDEGFLTQIRSRLVNGKMLARLCTSHTPLPSFVVGNQASVSPDVAEDVFEAFVGALYLDRGYDVAHRWLVAFFEENVDFAELISSQGSVRIQLNRMCVKQYGYVPETRVVSADANRVTVQVTSPTGGVLATGTGPNRREAEDSALRIALSCVCA